MARLLSFLLLLIVATTHAATDSELTVADFDGGFDGKSLFAVFHAPWCGHCKALMPAWKAVTEKATGDENLSHVAMGRVDCTAKDNEALCAKFKIQGFPTILYGSAEDLEPYEGGRDEESLLTFVRDMKPICGAGSEENCSEDELKTLDELAALDAEALQARIDKHEDAVKQIEAAYTAEVETLQARYTNITETKKNDLDSLRGDAKVGLVKSALRMETAKNKKEEL